MALDITKKLTGVTYNGDPFPMDEYDGDYEFTPSRIAQTIPIAGKTALYDIVIKSIPNNYGLITYNGFSLTVS